MFSFCSFQISFPNTCTVLIFSIAGLLFLCLEHVEHWERNASRWRPAFSSHLISRVTGHLTYRYRPRTNQRADVRLRPGFGPTEDWGMGDRHTMGGRAGYSDRRESRVGGDHHPGCRRVKIRAIFLSSKDLGGMTKPGGECTP